MAIDDQNLAVIAVIHPDIESRRHLAEDMALDAVFAKELIIIDRGTPKVSEIIVDDPDVNAFPGFFLENLQKAIPDLPGGDDEIFDEDVMAGFGHLVRHGGKGAVAERKKFDGGVLVDGPIRGFFDVMSKGRAVGREGIELLFDFRGRLLFAKGREIKFKVAALFFRPHLMGEKKIKGRADEGDSGDEKNPSDLIAVLGFGIDDENPQAQGKKPEHHDKGEGVRALQIAIGEVIEKSDEDPKLNQNGKDQNQFLPKTVSEHFHREYSSRKRATIIGSTALFRVFEFLQPRNRGPQGVHEIHLFLRLEAIMVEVSDIGGEFPVD